MNQSVCNKIILPYCPDYHKKRQIFNRSIQKYPCAIIYCEEEEEVKEAVRRAAEQNLIIRVRSGGHNYEGYCTGNQKLVIDTSRLKKIEICRRSHTVRIGSGVTNEELYSFLSLYGYPFAGGTCPTVAAVGLTQGGGWGHSSRMFGLTCDLLTEAELVDPQGELIAADERSHPDLFWALRGGGGGNFGVITSLTYRLLPKFNRVTYVEINYSQISRQTALRFFLAWQKWVREDEIRFTPNSRIFHSAEAGMGIFLRGFFYGTEEEAVRSVQPFLSICKAKAVFRSVTFLEATKIDAAVYPSSETFHFAGRFVRGCYTYAQIDSLLSLIERLASGSIYASVALYALGGAVRETAPWETSFYYRDADYIMGLETVWRNPPAKPDNLAWLKANYGCLHDLTIGSYINFPYLCTNEYMDAYYGKNSQRLKCIKKAYDPCNRFRFPQSIDPGYNGLEFILNTSLPFV